MLKEVPESTDDYSKEQFPGLDHYNTKLVLIKVQQEQNPGLQSLIGRDCH